MTAYTVGTNDLRAALKAVDADLRVVPIDLRHIPAIAAHAMAAAAVRRRDAALAAHRDDFALFLLVRERFLAVLDELATVAAAIWDDTEYTTGIVNSQYHPYLDMHDTFGDHEIVLPMEPGVVQRTRVPIAPHLRQRVYDRDGRACVECGGRLALALDHIIPHSRGGEDTYENLQTMCRSCNSAKGARSPEEWHAGREHPT